MTPRWTFNQKLAAACAAIVSFTVLVGAIASYALNSAVAAKDDVIDRYEQIVLPAEQLNRLALQRSADSRAFFLTRDEAYVANLRQARDDFAVALDKIRSFVDTEDARRMLDNIDRLQIERRKANDAAIVMARTQNDPAALGRFFDSEVLPIAEQVRKEIGDFVVRQQVLLQQARRDSTAAVADEVRVVMAVSALALLVAIIIATLLTRALGRQIGTAVGHVQSSSAELQAAATQQATGAKQQASAMSEITTTMSELVATSRQIAESAQRVAQIAEQTALSARSGDATVEKGQDAISGIRRQVDQVVGHMLDLGKKSQEIGTVLDIVSELAEQTNILAINATIEASGAGEAGKRFAVVAEEIRKLADRVGNSTKEIRSLIDDVRGAVNTSVMATEGGAKAVEAGARQFSEVATAFRQIASQVATATDAAREIELSTKQQATAAEQVRVAVTDVAHATRETEASSSQTLQTASQLAGLSLDLRRLVQAEAA